MKTKTESDKYAMYFANTYVTKLFIHLLKNAIRHLQCPRDSFTCCA